jgi:hypothetical protein
LQRVGLGLCLAGSEEKLAMASDRELKAGLRTMAADFHLPGGVQKKLARLVAGHLWWFDAAVQRGLLPRKRL